ncbi:MAG: signal peptide peptidase SppA [Vicinamibacteraceae bacterium]
MAARRGVWLVLVLIVVASLLSAAGVWFTASLTGGRASVPSSTALVLRLDADLGEVEGSGLFDRFVEGPPTVRALVAAIGRAKTDSRVKGLVLEPVGAAPFWARSQEIRDAILDFRKSGKKTIAFLEYGGEQEYFLATACEKVTLLPSSVLDLKGLATYEVFLRGAFDKIGVTPDFIHIGDYKTAINAYTQRTFTPAHREMAESLNHDTFDQLVQAIAVARKKTPETIRALFDEGPFIAEDALAAGLVDALVYRDEVEEKMGLGDEDTTDFADYVRALSPSFSFSSRPKIAVIYAVGTIASGEGPSGDVAGSDTLVEYINQAADDRSVKAIVLRVDSPGGSSIASDVIWRALMLAREEKPLIVSMGDLAASGGYYIAMPGHVIVAQPGTLTGSIGIYTGKFAIGGTLEKLGASMEAVSEGKMAQMDSPARPFTAAERAKIEEQVQAFYEQFVTKVAEARKSTPEKIDAVAQGRVWTGRQAKKIGLVDELGGLNRAIAIARERAKIAVGADVELVIYPPRASLFDALSHPLGQTEESSSLRSALALFAPADRRVMRQVLAPMRLLGRREPLALMPFVFTR